MPAAPSPLPVVPGKRFAALSTLAAALGVFESVETSMPSVLFALHSAVPLASSILIHARDGRPRKQIWHAEDAIPGALLRAEANALAAYEILTGPFPWRRTPIDVQRTPVAFMRRSRPSMLDGAGLRNFILLPLAIDRGAIFGGLQVEGTEPLTEDDLVLVRGVVSRLSECMSRAYAPRARVDSGRWSALP